MDIRIPRKHQAGFKTLYELPDEKKEVLVRILKEAPLGSSTLDLTIKLSLALDLELGRAQGLINALISCYSFVGDPDRNKDRKAEFIEKFPDALLESEVVEDGDNTDSIIQVISSALDLKESLGTISKAKGLAIENERLFVKARILTDFRPIFSDDDELKESIQSGIVMHQLSITFHKEESEHPEFFVALDNEDLQKLKEAVIRAERKEEKLRKDLDEKGIHILTLDGLHSNF